MPRQDEPVAVPGQSANQGRKRRQDDSQAGRRTDAPGKDPSDSRRSDTDITPSAGDPQVAYDPVDEPPVETATDDPDSTSDTILTPGSPSEYDRQRDARSNRDGDTWATDRTGR
jgi:hypothetical protein